MVTFVDELLDLEQPNFVVFSGDNVQTFDDPFHQKAVDAFTRGVKARSIPHVKILGNQGDYWASRARKCCRWAWTSASRTRSAARKRSTV